jgi:hypothetical protein
MQQQVEKSIDDTEVAAETFNTQASVADLEIQRMKTQLDRAVNRVSRAQDELDGILSLPPIQEPSYFEDVQTAQRLEPMTTAPTIRKWLSAQNTIKRIRAN